MNRPRHRPIIGPAPIDKIWLANELKEIKTLQAVTLAEVKDSSKKYVSLALEAAVNSVARMAKKIDNQVPDKNVPPGTTPTRKDS